MLRYWVWLSRAAGIGAAKMRRLLERFGTPREIYYADEAALQLAGLSGKETASLLDKDLSGADAILERCYQRHIETLTLQDSNYPEFLREIPDPPAVLYYAGRLPALSERPVLGVVGSRKASAYGLSAAMRLGYQLAGCGAVLVTGLARGVDSKAAEGALTAGGPVIGVLGCGVDVVYPPENRYLYKDVCRNGCILSEYPPGTPPYAGNFPVRNRILSGLCDGVIVVEAAEKSGALITADLALEQGRDVFVVPGNIDNPACAGSNQLLRNGAVAVTGGWDVMQEYLHRYPDAIREFNGGSEIRITEPMVASPVSVPEPEEERPQKKPIDITLVKDRVNADEYRVLEILTGGEKQMDLLIAQTGLPASRILGAVTLLEVKGFLKRLPGKRFSLAEE